MLEFSQNSFIQQKNKPYINFFGEGGVWIWPCPDGLVSQILSRWTILRDDYYYSTDKLGKNDRDPQPGRGYLFDVWDSVDLWVWLANTTITYFDWTSETTTTTDGSWILTVAWLFWNAYIESAGEKIHLWKCDESDWSIMYDSIGWVDGTINTSDLGSFHTENENFYSYQNEVGYSEGGVVDEELVTNGDFDTDTNWSKGSGWSINTGAANASSVTPLTSVLSQNIGLEAGKTYNITYEIKNYVSGDVSVRLGNSTFGTIRSGNGVYTETITQSSPSSVVLIFFLARTSSFTGSIDNVSVKEVYPDTVLVPRDESNPTKDVLGNDLQYKGFVGYAPRVVDSNVANFDGVGDYITVDWLRLVWWQPIWYMGYVSADWFPLGSNVLFSSGWFGSWNKWILFAIRSTWVFRFLVSDWTVLSVQETTWTITADWEPHTIWFSWNWQAWWDVNIYYDWELFETIVAERTWSWDSFDDLKYWAYGAGIWFWYGKKTDLSQYTRQLTQDDIDNFEANKTTSNTTDLTLHYTMASKGSTIYDKSGNGNNGTVTTSDLWAFWSTYDGRPDNIIDGFTKKLVTSTAGNSYIASTQAYGVWEQELYKMAGSALYCTFITDTIWATWAWNSYNILIDGNQQVRFRKWSTNLFTTANWYIDNWTCYIFRILRNSVIDEFITWAIGTFLVQIKWWAFTDWTNIDTTWWTWTNPVTDNTYTTSAYIVYDNTFVAGGQFKNLKTWDSVANLELIDMFDFTDDTGTYEQVRVPALEGSSTLDAEGSELSNPACVWHNGAESLLQYQAIIPEIYQDNSFGYWYTAFNIVGSQKEAYNTWDDNNQFNNNKLFWQTFTATDNYTAWEARLKLWKFGNPTPVTLEIRRVSDDLLMASGTVDATSFLASPGQFETITLTSVNDLVDWTQYRIEIWQSNEWSSDYLGWRYDNSWGYAGGAAEQSTDGGTTWIALWSGDFMFEIWTPTLQWITKNKVWYDDIVANLNNLDIYITDTTTYCKKDFLMYYGTISWKCLEKTLKYTGQPAWLLQDSNSEYLQDSEWFNLADNS